MKTLQFGLNIPTTTAPGNDPIGWARRAEALGFDFLSANDHLHATGPRHEVWTLLSWIAASTTRIRLATRVLGVPYRNPAVVAKAAETFDRLSGGRLVLGLGAGSAENEFRALGLETGSLGRRIEGLEDAIAIARGLWAGGPFSHDGRVYRTEAAEIQPPPDHPIPIWLGTVGPRGLAMTGRLADGWIPSIDLTPPDRAAGMIEQIVGAARAAGRDPDQITRAYNLEIRVGGPGSAEPGIVSGTPAEVADRLVGFIALGFNAFNLNPVSSDPDDQVERLAGEVIPAVRARIETGADGN